MRRTHQTMFAMLCGFCFAPAIAAAGEPIVVTPFALGGWYAERGSTSYLYGSGAAIELVAAPATRALGVGSLHLGTGANPDEGGYFYYKGFGGKRLADLSALRYRSYVTDNGTCNAPFLVLSLDVNKDGRKDDALVFEPCYQTGGAMPDQGEVKRGVWQTWDARIGLWWVRTGGPPVFSLENYLRMYPDATIVDNPVGGLRIGGGLGVVLDAYVDDLQVGFGGDVTRFDFEPQIGPPRSAAECRGEGWRGFNAPRFASEDACLASLIEPDLGHVDDAPPGLDMTQGEEPPTGQGCKGCQIGGRAVQPKGARAMLALIAALVLRLRRRGRDCQKKDQAAML